MDSKPRIAKLEVMKAQEIPCVAMGKYAFQLQIKRSDCEEDCREFVSQSDSLEHAIAAAVSNLCVQPIRIVHVRQRVQKDECTQSVVSVEEFEGPDSSKKSRVGIGRYVSKSVDMAMTVATIRAANHAGLLLPEFRSNHQRLLKQAAHEVIEELNEVLGLGSFGEQKLLEADSVVIEHLNRIASAAVLTATNAPNADSVLSLFDTSSWLYDSQGRKRHSFTDTSFWFAWYPGLDLVGQTVDSLLDTIPATPASKIPWIVRFFENPESWCRFRGAVDLEDHDVLHVLLGRGLQDQDESFVLGFAMGTAKRVRWWEYLLFQFVIGRLYPEPYRIPKFLHPAFRLGVRCGCETGNKDLYKSSLKELKQLDVEEARRQAGIDVQVLRKYYRQEQAAIPFTIASLRLP